jgi:alkylhydroperoxidase family enzyme
MLEWQMELTDPDAFAAAVLAGAKALEAGLGHEGYARAWVQHPFPVRALAALEAALATAPLPAPPIDAGGDTASFTSN